MRPTPSEPPSFGRFQPIALLGEGGMASVYLAHPRDGRASNKLLVVKQLRPELAREEAICKMFLDEGRLASRLNHRNVVQLFEVDAEGDGYFLTMEYLEGQTYGALVARASRDPGLLDARAGLALRLHVLTEVLAGLHYAHELTDFDGSPLSVVHRDVTPQNIFVTYDGLVKLGDFGIAKAADTTSSTESGVFKGKAAYAAPEQVLGRHVDRRADVFSVGVMLWEAVAGERLWGKVPNAAIFAQATLGKWRDLAEVAPHAEAQLVAIVRRAMAFDVATRYPTAEAMRRDLEAFARAHGVLLTPNDVGDVVTRGFDGERTELRRRVERHMREARKAESMIPPSSSPSNPRLDVATRSESGISARVPGSVAPLEFSLSLRGEALEPEAKSQGASVPPPPRGRGRVAAVVVVGLVAALAVSVAAFGRRPRGEGEGGTLAAGAPVAAPLADVARAGANAKAVASSEVASDTSNASNVSPGAGAPSAAASASKNAENVKATKVADAKSRAAATPKPDPRRGVRASADASSAPSSSPGPAPTPRAHDDIDEASPYAK